MELNILRSGSKARAKLDRVQAQIAEAATELRAVEGGTVSLEEARARLIAALEWPVQQAALAFESLLTPTLSHVALAAAMGLGEWAYLQGTEAYIDSVVDRISARAGLPASERGARADSLRERLHTLQVAQEQEVLELERRGHAVLRRVDADVALLLGVWADTRLRKRYAGPCISARDPSAIRLAWAYASDPVWWSLNPGRVGYVCARPGLACRVKPLRGA